MNKKIKIIIIVAVILIIVMVIFNTQNTAEKRIPKYLKSLKFTQIDDTYLYSKQISENDLTEHNNKVNQNKSSVYTILYFNVDSYQLTKDDISYIDGITKNFTPTYDYTNNLINYNYRVNYGNSNIVIDGTYNKKTEEFSCEPTFYYQIDIDKTITDICNKIKLDVENFDYEARTLIKEPNLLKYMNEKK